MKYEKNSSQSSQTPRAANSKIRTLIFSLELIFVFALLVLWLSSESLQQSKNLWVLFFYNFPSQFLIALVPHEPVVLFFGKFYSPFKVALVAVAGTVITETLNYSVFKHVANLKQLFKIRYNRFTQKVVDLFKKAPFAALWVAGFTPIPFYPFRFLVVLANYPLPKYLLAVFLSRTPRYFILSLVGYSLKIPDYLLVATFVILILATNIPILRNVLRSRKQTKKKGF